MTDRDDVAPPPPDPTTAESLPPPPRTATQRRPRAREVSSRFMTPLIHSGSTSNPNPNSPFRRPKSAQRSLKMDENQVPQVNRSLDGSSISIPSTAGKREPQNRVRAGYGTELRSLSSRPDTPITDRIVPSRYRQVNSIHRSNNSVSRSSDNSGGVSAASRLLQEATSDLEKNLSRVVISSSRDDIDSLRASTSCSSVLDKASSSCPSSPCARSSNKFRNGFDIRCSVSDVDKWLVERNGERTTSDCSRSLNFSSSAKMGSGMALPPHPRLNDVKKGKKVGNHQEDVHHLKLLANRYVQWRFANAKAEAALHLQHRDAQMELYELGKKISDLRDSVERKRHELAALRRYSDLTMITEAQIPYLDKWSTLEEDYSRALSETANALLNSSIRIPLNGEVRADPEILKEALISADEVVEQIGSHVQRFLNKAEEMDRSLSELARIGNGERALIEECGYILSRTHASQLQEFSFRSILIQFHHHHHHQ